MSMASPFFMEHCVVMMSLHVNWKAGATCSFKCVIKMKDFLKVTGSHAAKVISEMV